MQTTRGTTLSEIQNEGDGAGTASGTETGSRPRRIAVLTAVALTALLADQITKILVVAGLEGERPIELLGGLTTLRVTRNSGAAFSIGTGMTWVFTIIAIGVVIAIVRTARDLRSLPWALSLGLLLGGALGNLIDRVLRAPGAFQGHVVDWIEWPNWPVFNLADSAIVCGGVLAVVLAARGYQLDGTRDTGEKAGPVGSAGRKDAETSGEDAV
ncbi:signal peptidase II [Actinocorallia sp. B10E7]|uniref:signal peptidase II n=1 Tax=Actinocorallia sp. B10E7 TaxID=3153558 RepID=UPI00325D68EB